MSNIFQHSNIFFCVKYKNTANTIENELISSFTEILF